MFSGHHLIRVALVIGWHFFKDGSVRKGQEMVKVMEERDRDGTEKRMNLKRPWQKLEEMF